jgi:hypothetical protein
MVRKGDLIMEVMDIILLVLGGTILFGTLVEIIYFATLKKTEYINLDTGEVIYDKTIYEAIEYFGVSHKRIVSLKKFVRKYEIPMRKKGLIK